MGGRQPLLAIGFVLAGVWRSLCAAGTLDPVVVTASALPLTETALNQHASVYTREAIEREVPASVADFLSRRVGLFVEHGPRSGGYGSLFLRGADPSHVVVLVDGIRQNDPLSSRGSAVDLNTLVLDEVERIEIVRGNTSVVHREALAGVVQIFTRAPHDRARARVSAEAGGDGLRAASASAARGAWHASFGYREDGEGGDEGWSLVRAANLGFRERWGSTGAQLQLRLAESHNRAFPDDSGGEAHAVLRSLESRRSETGQLAVALDHELGESDVIELRLARFRRDSSQDTPPVAPGLRDPFGLPRTETGGEYRRDEAELHWRRQAASGWDLLVGAGYQSERGELESRLFLGVPIPADFEIDRSVGSLVAEAYRSFGPWRVQAGLRYEYSEDFGAQWHPALSLQYRPVPRGPRIGAAFSSASKLPSFFALGHPLVGNPDLEPERGRQAELYFATGEDAPWKARITLFHARYLDLVDFDPGPPPRLVNRAAIRSTGVEFTLRRAWRAGLVTYAQGTAMELRDPDGGPPLRLRPERQAAVGVEARFGGGWQAHWRLAYVGRRFDSSIPTGGVRLGAYTEMDLALTWTGAGWRAFAAVDNLLDREAEETVGTSIGGRRLRAGVSLRF